MEDAKDQHNLAFDLVEDAVAAMEGGADVAAKFRLPSADLRMTAQQIEDLPETTRISIRDLFPERRAPESVDVLQVGFCRRA